MPSTAHPLPLPKVCGRHRNKALAAARKQRAIELRLQGWTYQAIADEMGYASQSTVYTIIKTAQAAELGAAARERRELEVGRLDALQQALWPAAAAGDLQACEQVRRIIEARCRLLGLLDVRQRKGPRSDWPCCQGPATVVIREDDCRLQGCEVHGRL